MNRYLKQIILPIHTPPIIQTTLDYADMFTMLPLINHFRHG